MRLEHVLRRLQAGRLRVAALDGRHKIDLLRRLEHRVYGRRPSVVEREGLEALEISDVARVLLPAGRYAELPETGAVPHGRLADEDQPRHLRLDGVVAWPDRRELADDLDARLDRLFDDGDDGVAVVRLDDERLVLPRRDRILDLHTCVPELKF